MAGLTEAELAALVEAIAKDPLRTLDSPYDLYSAETGKQALALPLEDQMALIRYLFDWLKQPDHRAAYPKQYVEGWGCQGGRDSVVYAFGQLLEQPLPLELDVVLMAIAAATQTDYFGPDHKPYLIPISGLLTRAWTARAEAGTGPPPELRQAAEKLCGSLEERSQNHKAFALRRLIQSNAAMLPLEPGEAWVDCAIADLDPLPPAEKFAWVELLLACWNAEGSKPKRDWWETVEAPIGQIGVDSLQSHLATWLNLVAQPRTVPADPRMCRVMEGYSSRQAGNGYAMYIINVAILKGLCWVASRYFTPEIVRGLGQVVLGSFRKVPGVGPVCIRLGNAALWALGQIADRDSTVQLAQLKAKVKLPSAQNSIAKALIAVAEKSGVSPAELEELSVPDFGFAAVGHHREPLGEATAELVVTGNQVTLTWFNALGKPQKTMPKAVKDNYGDELKDLKQTVKDIQGLLPALRDRIESSYLTRRTWPLVDWRDRYLDHPLVGTLARRLIWQFATADQTHSAIWHDGHLVTVEGQALAPLPPETTVSLWHPLVAAPQTVAAWRSWLVDHQVQQPFKQAHRELYLLTEAEQATETYSNRFAAHLLKQSQFHALCNQRGWRDRLRMMNAWEPEPSEKLIPAWNLRAEFWMTGIGEDYDPDLTTDAGGYRYLSTDQVRFYEMETPLAPLALETIPALVFSEVMRDVDLFVGVASVGNDPAWRDGGPGQYRDYWHSYAFGLLSATAQTRRQVLETLLPKLAIRDRCSFADRFLVVRGDLRTYNIHLGSGNILMEPNDQYLCIVPDPRKAATMGNVFLPFEGDSMMATILSKALLLANDTKIKDPSILSQIQSQSRN